MIPIPMMAKPDQNVVFIVLAVKRGQPFNWTGQADPQASRLTTYRQGRSKWGVNEAEVRRLDPCSGSGLMYTSFWLMSPVMMLSPRQCARARRWLPLWSLLLVLMSFGSWAATDLCNLDSHCSQAERTLEKAMPCGSFTAALAMTVLNSDGLTVSILEPDRPLFVTPSPFMPGAPPARLERPPRQPG